ncbi:MAG: alpha/beta fold hydrolase [Clostridiales bacterium]|nr:alpha/beta fold hydrolase [Clostridiales bacterium]
MKKTLLQTILLWILLMVVSLSAMGENNRRSAKDVVMQLKNQIEIEELYETFSPLMQQSIAKEQLLQLWSQIELLGGEILTVEESPVQTLGTLSIYSAVLMMEKQNFIFTVTYNQDDLIEGMAITPLEEEKQQPIETETPTLPEGIEEYAVTINQSPWELTGTITLPVEKEEKIPGVVLVHGSGPQDQNEKIGEISPFRDIAWGLAKEGIASIRYDKRTYLYGNEMVQTFGEELSVQEEVVEDAVSAAKVLAAFQGVEEKQLFIVGHSLGAMLTPRIAKEALSQDISFRGMILLAGTPKSLVDITVSQNQAVIHGDAKIIQEQKTTLLTQIDNEKKVYDTLLALPKEETLGKTVFGQPAYYFWEMDHYPLLQSIETLSLPMLILQGEEDFHVSMKDGLLAWKEYLADVDKVEYKSYADLNHLFVKYEGEEEHRYTLKEYDTPGTVDTRVIKDIGQFIFDNREE